MFTVALGATVVMIFSLVGLRQLEAIIPSRVRKVVTVTCPSTGAGTVARFQELLVARGATIQDVQYVRDDSSNIETVTFHVSISSRQPPADLIDFGDDAPQTICCSVE